MAEISPVINYHHILATQHLTFGKSHTNAERCAGYRCLRVPLQLDCAALQSTVRRVQPINPTVVHHWVSCQLIRQLHSL